MSWAEIIVWATYGFALGAASLTALILFSTIFGPPAKGARPIEQLRVFATRVPFWLLVVLGLMVQRPLVLRYGLTGITAPTIAFCFLILTLVFGVYVLLPRFITIKITASD